MKAIYDSAWHHPFVAWVVGLGLLVAVARRLPFLYAYTVLFTTVILADALATGGWSPIPLGTPAYTFWSVVFIILGDFRYFFLVERVTHPDEPLGRVLARSGLVSLIVPLVTGVMTRTIPAMQNDRVLYLVYEPALGLIVLGLDRLRYARGDAPEPIKRYVRGVSLLFATLYFGWAACDALILAGVELGHVLRIVPNVLYYAAFLPFVFATAPEGLRALAPPAKSTV